MAKADIIVSGTSATATFNSALITDVNTITFGVVSARDEIDLSSLDNSAYNVGMLGDLVEVEDIVINKKFAPAVDLALSTDNKTLVIAYKAGDGLSSKTATYWAQLKDISNSEITRAPGDGVNVDLIFAVTNLNASLEETGPVLA